MATNRCPKCSTAINTASINVAEGVGFCHGCDTVWRLNVLAVSGDDAAADLAATRPAPKGCTSDTQDGTLTLRAACFQPSSFILLFVALFWLGFTGSAWTASLITVLASLRQPPLTAGIEAASPASSNPIAWGALFFVVVLSIFVAVGLYLLTLAMVSIFGHCRARISRDTVELFTGVARLGWRRTVPRTRSITTRLEGDSSNTSIVLDTTPPLKFGALLKDERRTWLAGMLRQVLASHP